MFKVLKPGKDGLKVFNPATGLHLKEKGEEVSMSSYWKRMIKCGDAVEVKPAQKQDHQSNKKQSQKNNSEV